MKKFIPLFITVILIAVVIAGCTTTSPETPSTPSSPATPSTPSTPSTPATPSAPDTPVVDPLDAEYQELLVDIGLVEPGIKRNPFGESFATKPDGTPYLFAYSVLFLGVDTLSQGAKFQESIIDRAGGDSVFADPGLDAQKQISWIEDLIAGQNKPDCLIFQAVNENMLVPVVDQAWAAGIPSIIWDIDVFSDNKVSFILHDFAGAQGSNLLGQYFVDRAEAENKEMTVLEIWGQRSLQTAQDRHTGFRKPIDASPLITVIESSYSNWSPEEAANITMNELTAHPEIGGIYSQEGEAPGVVEGLRSIGRLLPVDDPDHVIVATNDIDTLVAQSVQEGTVDACGSHQSVDLQDIATQVAFTYSVLGQNVPARLSVPMYLVTPENVNTLKMLGIPIYPLLPPGRWDLWPPSDCAEIGLPQPTEALRMQYQGY